MLFSADFWRDAAQRSFRTFCQTLAAVLGGSALNVWSAGWHNAIGVAAGSALISFLMAVDRSSGGVSAAPSVTVVEPVRVEPVVPVSTVTACGDSLRQSP